LLTLPTASAAGLIGGRVNQTFGKISLEQQTYIKMAMAELQLSRS